MTEAGARRTNERGTVRSCETHDGCWNEEPYACEFQRVTSGALDREEGQQSALHQRHEPEYRQRRHRAPERRCPRHEHADLAEQGIVGQQE